MEVFHMNILKKILLGFVVIVLLLLIVALLLPANVKVERSIVINAADSVVFDYLTDFTHRADWDPWLEMEPTAKVTLSETTQGVGAGYAWKGEEIGSGKMTIVEVLKNKSITSKIEFISPQTGEGDVYWNLEPATDGTNLTWTFQSDMDYPVGRYFGLFMDSMLGPSLEKGLLNIDMGIQNQSEQATESESSETE